MQSRNVIPGVPNTPRNSFEAFGEVDPTFPERNLRITGVTKDSGGNPLGSCNVVLVESPTNIASDNQVSDANGNYMLQITCGLSQPQRTKWRVDAYKSGAPDVAGTTVNTLVGS